MIRFARLVAVMVVGILLGALAPLGASPSAAGGAAPGQVAAKAKVSQTKLTAKGKVRQTKVSAAKLAPLRKRVEFGAWVAGMVADPSQFSAREAQLGAPLKIASYFLGYGDWFPTAYDAAFAKAGKKVLISWDMGPYRFTDWSSGQHDDYLRLIGSLAAKYPYPLYVRPWAEMNGDWVDYQPTAAGEKPYGGTPAQFKQAWEHVVQTVRAAGGTNIKWVFNPYAATYAEATDITTIWPGRAYVDVLGIDGYNWGGGPTPWQTFNTVFTTMYNKIAGLDSTLPIWICEVGSREPSINDGAAVLSGRSKGAWVTDMFAQTGFARLAAIVWFDEAKERDWRFDSSPAALSAFRTALGG